MEEFAKKRKKHKKVVQQENAEEKTILHSKAYCSEISHCRLLLEICTVVVNLSLHI